MAQLVGYYTGEQMVAIFESHDQWNHCVVSLSKTLHPLVEHRKTHPNMTEIFFNWDIKNKTK